MATFHNSETACPHFSNSVLQSDKIHFVSKTKLLCKYTSIETMVPSGIRSTVSIKGSNLNLLLIIPLSHHDWIRLKNLKI